MSSSEEVQDPLSNSISEQEEEQPQPPPDQEGLPTSSVYNLSAYDVTTVQEEKVIGINQTQYCCEMDRTFSTLERVAFLPDMDPAVDDIRHQERPLIIIEDAQKAHDMSGKPFMSYLIKTTLNGYRIESKHRYSEFESLRNVFVQQYPSIVVPPIPEKHSVVQYAAKPGKAMQDPKIVMKRKRLLQSFLNRVASHPVLRSCHPFHVFLMGDTPWSEVVSLSHPTLKKKPSIASLGIESRSLRKPDLHFQAAQDYTNRFGNQISFIRKLHKKIIGYYGDISSVYAELGALYNAWSLQEHQVSEGIEQVGQAVDSTLTSTNILFSNLEERFGDTLVEYEKFSNVIQQLLISRHRAHLEFESISENLILKQQSLAKLESSEHESQRLAAILSVEGQPPIPISRPTGIMAHINALIDNDPESTRRNTISKTRDQITLLEDQREESRVKLLKLNSEIQTDLDRFQKQKVADVRNLLLAFCLAHKEYHSRAIAAWRGAKDAINRIE